MPMMETNLQQEAEGLFLWLSPVGPFGGRISLFWLLCEKFSMTNRRNASYYIYFALSLIKTSTKSKSLSSIMSDLLGL